MNYKNPIKVLVTRPLPEQLYNELSKAHPELQLICAHTDKIMGESDLLDWTKAQNPYGIIITLAEKCLADFIRKLPESVKVISTIAVGTDNIDKDACEERRIKVFNTPDVLTEATADLTWALILATSRRILEGHKTCIENQFNGWSPTLLLGKELHGATLGIVGLGRIGRAVAKRACGFGMKIIYYNRNPIKEIEKIFPKDGNIYPPQYVHIDEVCKSSDVVSLHCPLNEDSYHMFNEPRLRSCKADAIIINMARGPVIDENALVRVLMDGHFMGVGLDVYEKEPQIHSGLKEIDRVILLPHIGSATTHTRWKMMRMSIDAILKEHNL